MRPVPTVYDVARRARVSIASVSRVLGGDDRVRPVTRERVLDAVGELGYVQSGAAKGLASRRTTILGLCFPDLAVEAAEGDTNFWYDELIRGMERAARRSGYMLLIAASHESDDVSLVATVASMCDGLVALADCAPSRVLERIASRTPLVLLGHTRLDLTSIDYLYVANESGAHDVTAHLADAHALSSIAFVAGTPSPDGNARFAGYQRAMRERGLDCAEAPIAVGDWTTLGGHRVAESLLADGRLPQALVCVNDQTAIGVISRLHEARVAIPDDIAVTGFDGIHLGRAFTPSLTTVGQPVRRLGEIAVDLLVRRIADHAAPPRHVELPVRLRLNRSCGCLGQHRARARSGSSTVGR